MNRRQLYWGNIITTRNVLAGVSVSEAGPQPGTGKPGNYPPEIFANMMVFVLYMKRFFSKLCYLYVNVFPRQPFCIRMCCVISDKSCSLCYLCNVSAIRLFFHINGCLGLTDLLVLHLETSKRLLLNSYQKAFELFVKHYMQWRNSRSNPGGGKT